MLWVGRTYIKYWTQERGGRKSEEWGLVLGMGVGFGVRSITYTGAGARKYPGGCSILYIEPPPPSLSLMELCRVAVCAAHGGRCVARVGMGIAIRARACVRARAFVR